MVRGTQEGMQSCRLADFNSSAFAEHVWSKDHPLQRIGQVLQFCLILLILTPGQLRKPSSSEQSEILLTGMLGLCLLSTIAFSDFNIVLFILLSLTCLSELSSDVNACFVFSLLSFLDFTPIYVHLALYLSIALMMAFV